MNKIILISLIFIPQIAFSAAIREKPRMAVYSVQRASTVSIAPTTTQNTQPVVSVEQQNSFNEMDDLRSRANAAINDARNTCTGIFPQLQDIQLLTGVTVTVSAIGTLTGATALTTGIIKFNKDAKIEELKSMLENFQSMTREEWFVFLYKQAEMEKQQEIQELEKQSKMLGNVRTGTLAATTVTSVTSTVTSAFTIKKIETVIEKVKSCQGKVAALRKIDDEYKFSHSSDYDAVLASIPDIANSCGLIDPDQLGTVQKEMKATSVVSGVGGGVALGGTIVSAVANTDKIRDDDSDAGKQKEKNLNLAANITAGVATATSGASTILSGIAAYNLTKNAELAARCEEVLKQ